MQIELPLGSLYVRFIAQDLALTHQPAILWVLGLTLCTHEALQEQSIRNHRLMKVLARGQVLAAEDQREVREPGP